MSKVDCVCDCVCDWGTWMANSVSSSMERTISRRLRSSVVRSMGDWAMVSSHLPRERESVSLVELSLGS